MPYWDSTILTPAPSPTWIQCYYSNTIHFPKVTIVSHLALVKALNSQFTLAWNQSYPFLPCHSCDWVTFPQTFLYNCYIIFHPITSRSTWTKFSHPEYGTNQRNVLLRTLGRKRRKLILSRPVETVRWNCEYCPFTSEGNHHLACIENLLPLILVSMGHFHELLMEILSWLFTLSWWNSISEISSMIQSLQLDQHYIISATDSIIK
jgi:hypothetical protein